MKGSVVERILSALFADTAAQERIRELVLEAFAEYEEREAISKR
jgi:metal-dependent HD superfamily phosphatase/phosphodiesterase